ncbi:MAG: ABC transporter substrate-binding protein [Elusimicrobia bacterium]|nr:ABC transporter substrate-binding protein [Elusimicrobiota bacterium]
MTLTFLRGQGAGSEYFFRSLIARFEKGHPGIRVRVETLPWQTDRQHQIYSDHLRAQGVAFDVMSLDVIWIAEFAQAGWLRDLDNLLSQEEKKNFLPVAIRACTYRDRLYAVPWFTDAGVLYYRKDLLEKYGTPVPETWEELVRTAAKILKKEENPHLQGFLWQGKRYEGLVCNALEYVWSMDNRLQDEQGRWSLDGSRAVRSLQFMADLIRKAKVSPELVAAADEEMARQIFQNGGAVFMRNWPYAIFPLESEDSSVRGKVGIASLPRFSRGESVSTLGGWNLGVNRFSRHPKEAFQFIRYMTSPSVQREMLEGTGSLPTRFRLYREPKMLRRYPHLARMEEILARARPRPVTSRYPEVSETLQQEISAVLADLKSPKEAVVEIERKLPPLLK